MNWLCDLRLGAFGLVFGGAVIFAYLLGSYRATRRHWRMLQKAGSKFPG